MGCCHSMTRRSFVGLTAAGLAAAGVIAGESFDESTIPSPTLDWDPDRAYNLQRKPLVVQPLLRHEIEKLKPKTSWRNWGGVHTEEDAAAEMKRIAAELQQLGQKADFPLEILPLARAPNDAEGARVREESPADVMILYAAGANRLDPCITPRRHHIIFVRHRSGPVYDWYENASNRFLRIPGKEFEYDQYRNFAGVGVDDVVVDDYGEILWRLRALAGVKNFLGSRAVVVGKASGKGCPKAPEVCRDKYQMEIVEVSYAELERRIKAAWADGALRAQAEACAKRYLGQPGIRLETQPHFVVNAVYLYGIFKQLLQEHDAQSFTIGSCMSTIMPVADTTACLALSMLQDEGRVAFCEADFVVHPAGVLLQNIAGRPVFMHNPTFPHQGVVTCAHCTCPRRLDGKSYDSTRIRTHYESDFGASPKVEFPQGRQLTVVNPDAAQVRWLGFKGRVVDNPDFPICRTQQDLKIEGDWKRLAREIRGSHWMMTCGDYLPEMGYAAAKVGLEWLNVSEA